MLLAVALIVVFAFSLSWIWTTLAFILRSPQTITTLSFAVLFPLWSFRYSKALWLALDHLVDPTGGEPE